MQIVCAKPLLVNRVPSEQVAEVRLFGAVAAQQLRDWRDQVLAGQLKR